MEKVVIGMSGGVDSSVAAYVLKKQGYEVIGLFMRNWDSYADGEFEDAPTTDLGICPQEVDYNDAKKVCDKLGIPLYRKDFVKEYWDYVFTYFLDELKMGRTPNPDIMCNKYIKFDTFAKEAEKLGADYIATGHYARIKDGKLLRAIDDNKDQTYFLSQVSKAQLENVLFPIGDMVKPDVRKLALELGLDTASKKDSTGICFIGERHYQEFVQNYLKPNSGDIIDVESKNIIGTHTGLMNYTIGQRRNVGLSGHTTRHYVCGKNVAKNILYVAFGDSKYLYSDACVIDNLNILEELPSKLTAKFRYRGEDISVIVESKSDTEIKLSYPELAKSVTPGQACVLYDKEECLGGGIIKEVIKNNKKIWYL